MSSLHVLNVVVRMAGGLVASKMIAQFLGPSGLAIISNYRNFLVSLETYATLGLSNGVVKYIAQNKDDHTTILKTLTTVFTVIICTIILTGLLLFCGAVYLNTLIFKSGQYTWIFKITALALPWCAGNVILIAVINGLGLFKKVIYINIISNILGVIISTVLIWQTGIKGAILGLLISPAIIFILSFYHCTRHFKGFNFFSAGNFDKSLCKGLLSYSFMALFTALISPFVFISLRNNIILHFNYNEAGYWDAISRISVFYLMFFTTILTGYFFPKLAQAKSDKEIRMQVVKYYKLILPVYITGSIALYFTKNYIIGFLFTDDFLPVSHLFFWQLLGDFFKVIQLVFTYILLAKKMTRVYIITEIAGYCILYISGMYFTELYGSEGAVIAHVITSFCYMLVLLVYFRKIIF